MFMHVEVPEYYEHRISFQPISIKDILKDLGIPVREVTAAASPLVRDEQNPVPPRKARATDREDPAAGNGETGNI